MIPCFALKKGIIVISRKVAFDMYGTAIVASSVVLVSQARTTSGSGKSDDEILEDVAADILAKLPASFDTEDALRKYPTTYNQVRSVSTVTAPDCYRMNLASAKTACL